MEVKSDLKISDMLQMSRKLWELHKDSWSPMEPEYGKDYILYMIEEIGEAIALIKKKGEAEIMNDPDIRSHFVEELADALMYFTDTLNRYHITPEEFCTVYCGKYDKNRKRDYVGEYQRIK